MNRTSLCLRAAALAALAVACLGAPTAALALETVGDLQPIQLRTASPYAAGDRAEWTVRQDGATYIRLHFSRFDLAPGDTLTVSNAWGTESYAYQGRGPHGTGEFWAFAIVGDTAIVRLQAVTGGYPGVEADAFGRGFAPVLGDPVEPDSVCGTTDWRDVECYRDSNPTEFEAARGAVKALIGCCSACTAFKVSDSGQFMTNNHCTSSQSGVQSTELRFEYQNSACGGGSSSYTGAVMGSSLLRTDALYDYTLMTTVGSSASIPCLPLDAAGPANGERIYIAGHPSGGPKKLSIHSTHSADASDGFCHVNAFPYPGNGSDTDAGYYCDTTNGSSGSPVIAADNGKVVALHHFGGCLNSGGRMDRIYAQISNLLDSCSGGGGGTCGNGTIEAGEDCDGGDLGGQTCESLGYASGALACSSSCQFDTSGCVAACGAPGASCTGNAQCCSGSCKGKPGRKTCR
jgi:lysyl endopeptidase